MQWLLKLQARDILDNRSNWDTFIRSAMNHAMTDQNETLSRDTR